MNKKFNIDFLGEAYDFVESLDEKTRTKIYYNARKTQVINDPELFKKLNEFIWEFRTKYNKNYYRLLAFWDKTEKEDTLVLATHGFIKKTNKTPKTEIKKAEEIRKEYFERKQRKMKSDRLKRKSLDELIDKHIGEIGTEKRDNFEQELRLDILGQTIKRIRKEKNLTQAQLGELVGVKKAQISKIENNLNDARFDTILKVFRALNAKISFNIEMMNQNLSLG
jgi:HTH-type transcriptional regulator/antitoxin HipB